MYEDRFAEEPGLLETLISFITSPTLWLIIIMVAILWSTIVITTGKRAKIIEQFGKPLDRARLPGLSFKLPWPIQTVVGEVNLQQQEAKDKVAVKTKDNAFMDLPVIVQYKASDDPAGAVRAHYELENPEAQMVSYVLKNVKDAAGDLAMQELYTNRDAIETEVRTANAERFAKYGYELVNILIDEPQPSAEVKASFNRVIASEREKEAAQNIADAQKIKLVGIAKAEKESKQLQGEGMAKMREAIAKGMKESMETLEASGLSTEQALELLMDTNRLDTLGSAAAHGNMVLVDLQSGGDMAKTVGAVRAAEGAGTRNRPGPVAVESGEAEAA